MMPDSKPTTHSLSIKDPNYDPFRVMEKWDKYAVVMYIKGMGYRQSWPVILLFDDPKDAEKFDRMLKKTRDSAEKDYDKGKGDTSDPDEDGYFQVQPNGRDFGKTFIVIGKNGGIVAQYETKKEANAVANALNETVEETKKKKGCFDPISIGQENIK